MQSILLATPSKASKLETSNENKLSADAISSQGKTEEGKNATGFASILEQTVSEKKEAKSDVSSSELLAKGALNKKENEGTLLAEKDQPTEASAEASKVAVNSLASNKKTNLEGKSQENLKVASSIGSEKITDVQLIDTDVDDNTAHQKAINQSIADTTKLANNDTSATQVALTQETLKSDALPLETQDQQNNDLSSAAVTTENARFAEAEANAVVHENKQADVLAIGNEALSSNAKGVSLEKETKLTKEQSITHFSKEVTQADSEIISSSDLVEVSPESASEAEAIEASTELDVPVLAEESNKQNLSKQLDSLETNNIEDNNALNVKEDKAQVLSSDAVNKSSDEVTEEQNTDAVIANINALSSEVPVVKQSNNNNANGQEPPENEQDTVYSASESEQELSDQFINPILAQIQAAQNTDTKVTDNKQQTLGISNIDKDSKKGDKANAQDVAKNLLKSNATNIENVLADDNADSVATEKDLINKANISANEKIEGMLANLKAETTKPVFNQNTDSHSINTLGVATASADKLLNQTQASITNPTLQSTALQQPIELHSKQAAAMVGERIMMMINQGKQEVNIRLDPAELGSMHIKVQVQQEQVQVAIHTQVGQSRDIIEQNLPRLREQLAQQGINLGEASVEQQSKQNQGNSQGSSQMAGSVQGTSNRGDGFVEEQSEFFPTQITLPAQGIDYYA